MQKKASSKDLRSFGLLIGSIFFLIWLFNLLLNQINYWLLLIIGLILIITGIIAPKILHYPYIGWMFIAQKMGIVMNKVVLSIFFFLILTPVAVIRKLFNKDPLDLSWDKSRDTYFSSKTISKPNSLKNKY